VSKEGQVPWETSPELSRHMASEIGRAKKKRKEVMGRMQLNVQGFNEDEEKILAAQYEHEQVTMSEDEMLGLLGEAAQPAAEQSSEAASDAALHPIVGEIEAQLAGVGSVLAKVQEHVKSTTSSKK
jgi:small subunit ribosomal protein S2